MNKFSKPINIVHLIIMNINDVINKRSSTPFLQLNLERMTIYYMASSENILIPK